MHMLDTNICIYLINQRDPTLRDRFERHAPDICISAITYAELCFGVIQSARSEHNVRELDAFRQDLDILPFDESAGVHYGEIRHALMRSGYPMGANDLLIAAHARSREATIVTNDERAFRQVPDLRVENWLRA